MRRYRYVLLILAAWLCSQAARSQTFHLFSDTLKSEFPSVVYDFLERYLYEIDSLERRGEPIMRRIMDDKVVFLQGTPSAASGITPQTTFTLSSTDDRYYQASWMDSTENEVLSVAFPMQYELLLGMPKVQIEQTLKETILTYKDYHPLQIDTAELTLTAEGCWTTTPTAHYYIESLNTARYYHKTDSGLVTPVFDSSNRWHAAANLFLGAVDSIEAYQLYVEQNLYGFQQKSYMVSLASWLAYCQAMKLDLYFAVEEEREDGLKALLIARSTDLGFNHMLSIILPDNFVTKRNAVIKVTMNAYIPTQNVKDLYQQYVAKPKKKI